MRKILNLIEKGLVLSYEMDTLAFGIFKKRKNEKNKNINRRSRLRNSTK